MPASAVGRKPSNTFGIKLRLFQTVFQKYTIEAVIAPAWILIDKTSRRDCGRVMSFPASRRWAVDETGMNSVSPSTIPNIIV